jgi:hypothetical protein
LDTSSCQPPMHKRMFVSCQPTGVPVSRSHGTSQTPNPRGRVSCGERPVPTTGPGRGPAIPGAPSCSSRRAARSPTCGSRTRLASHPSPPSAATTRRRRHRWRSTRCGPGGNRRGSADPGAVFRPRSAPCGQSPLGGAKPGKRSPGVAHGMHLGLATACVKFRDGSMRVWTPRDRAAMSQQPPSVHCLVCAGRVLRSSRPPLPSE